MNAIAYLRNRRELPWPDLIELARQALDANAHGITVHPRPDQRHIKLSDLKPIRNLIDDEFPDREFNIEGYPNEEFIKQVIENQPEQATLVPDDPSQSTSYFGWDYKKNKNILEPVIKKLKKENIRVAVFSDPDTELENLKIAKDIGADRIEIYTGPYGATYDNPKQAQKELEIIKKISENAEAVGLGINAGHDLTLQNLPPLVEAIPKLKEVSIGHAITADMFKMGMKNAVIQYLKACRTKE